MSISRQLNQLYDKWKCKYLKGQFIRHGLVDEDSYNRSEPKVVLIGREVNAIGNNDFDLLDFLREELKIKAFKKADILAGL